MFCCIFVLKKHCYTLLRLNIFTDSRALPLIKDGGDGRAGGSVLIVIMNDYARHVSLKFNLFYVLEIPPPLSVNIMRVKSLKQHLRICSFILRDTCARVLTVRRVGNF